MLEYSLPQVASEEERREKFNEAVIAYQEPLENEEEKANSMEGQTYRDVNNESRFSGNADQGKEIFKQIEARNKGEQSQQISGYLTTHGAMINNEPYDEIPANSVQATPEQVGEVNRLAQNNSNEMK